jgi:Domain of unknown function (DUF4397)
MTMNRYRSTIALVCAALLTACGDSAVQKITSALPGSAIKFYNFGVCGTTQTTTTSCMPNVNFYANDTKMTAISSTTGSESSTGTAYGSVGNGALYSGIEPGQYTISGRISAAGADKDAPVSNTPVTLADGKFYSYYLSGFYNATAKTVDSFIVEDDLPAADFSVTYVRFVNAISNSNPMILYAKNPTSGVETAIGGAVAYKSAGPFVSLPAGPYDLSTRYAGTTTDVITRKAVGFSPGHVYTISSRGDITITSTTAINRPSLDNTANK